MALLGRKVQQVNERKRVVVSYDAWLADGEVLSGVVCMVDQGTAIVDGVKVLSDNRTLQFFISNGTLGDLYNVIIEADTSFGQRRYDHVAFTVETNGGPTMLATNTALMTSIIGPTGATGASAADAGVFPISLAEGGFGGTTAKDSMRLASGIYVLGSSAVQVSHTGDVLATVLASVTVPANSMGPNGRLRITSLWSMPNNANTKTFTIRLGGAAGSIFQNITATTQVLLRAQIEIANRNVTNVQVGMANGASGGFGVSTGSLSTGSRDTTVDQDVAFICTCANAGDTISLESYLVELIANAGS